MLAWMSRELPCVGLDFCRESYLRPIAKERRILIMFLYSLGVILNCSRPIMACKRLVAFLLQSDSFFFCRHLARQRKTLPRILTIQQNMEKLEEACSDELAHNARRKSQSNVESNY